MTAPVQITPQRIAEDAMRLQQKLAAAPRTLREVGDFDYGATTRQEVWRDGKVVLYRFVGEQAPTRRPPLLIVYALVNRPYMVDLQADRSLVQKLLALGQDVYVLDWGYPDRSERFQTLEDYLLRYIDGAVDALRARSGGPVEMLGICQGGVFALCYAALRRQKLGNLITMVTPVDFHTADNMLSHWARQVDVDLLVDTLGNIPADLMNASYLMLKPFRLNVQKYVGLLDILDDKQALEDFLRMEKWIFDSPDLAGEAFREFVTLFYQRNGLVTGQVSIGGQAVDLQALDMPVLNIYAEHDHLVPPDASRALGGLVGSDDYSELSFRGGHIGIYVSGRAQREVPVAIHRWLQERGGNA